MPVWEQLATDQFVPRQIFTLYDYLLISEAFIVHCRVGCPCVTGVFIFMFKLRHAKEKFVLAPMAFTHEPILRKLL